MKSALVQLCSVIVLLALFSSCQKDPRILPSYTKDSAQAVTPAPDTAKTPATAEKEIVETTPAVQTEGHHVINDNCAGFYKALPAHYNETTQEYPLLVFLHGSQERGNGNSQLSRVLKNAVPNLLNKKKFPASFKSGGKNYSFIVVSPQFKSAPSPDDIFAVIRYMTNTYRVDVSRIYITGLSLGGGATWYVGAEYASKIAAIVPICGSSNPVKSRAESIASANLPVWAFHNADDHAASVTKTKNYVALVNSFNPKVKAKMTIWAKGGHDAWTKATNPDYRENGMNMYEWMLQYKR
ncbi:MAG: dienelactone hydrolase family protein [Agriterribacter sp.]